MVDLAGEVLDALNPFDGVPEWRSVPYDVDFLTGLVLDSNAPVISNVVPAPGSVIERNTPWQFDVTDDLGLTGVIVKVRFPGRPTETIYDVDTFEPFYTGSSVSTIDGGFRFVIRRLQGWPAPPTFFARAIDLQGNHNA